MGYSQIVSGNESQLTELRRKKLKQLTASTRQLASRTEVSEPYTRPLFGNRL